MTKPIYGSRSAVAVALVAASALALAVPDPAGAHGGPGHPVASSYLAKVLDVPAGLDAKVVDGDLRMWLRVRADATVVVLDYRGAPYLRFDRTGVQVNRNSEMWYLNQTPVAETPPADLTASTPPSWASASNEHQYSWHDGRLHALATVALAPGTRFVGAWTVPITVDGDPKAIRGGLWHSDRPPLVWFWPILVMLACAQAAIRLKRPRLDARLIHVTATAALIALAAASVGRGLQGHPDIAPSQYVELGVILAFAGSSLYRILFQRHGWFTHFVIAAVVLWQGLSLIAVLFDGFVLIDLPAFAARVATMLCLACGLTLLLLAFSLSEPPARPRARRTRLQDERRAVRKSADIVLKL